jgi:hypothetical protein
MYDSNNDFSFEDADEKVISKVVVEPNNPRSRQEINREYYVKHRARLAEQKKRRWRCDPEYRARAAIARKKHYAKEKQKAIRLREAEARDDHNKRYPFKSKTIRVKGKLIDIEVITFGNLANLCKINRVTLHKWVAEGLVPQPTFLTKGGHRIYTRDEASVIVRSIRFKAPKFKIESWKGNQKEDFKYYLKKRWDTLRYGMTPKTFMEAFEESHG